jgi:hypothetical protein
MFGFDILILTLQCEQASRIMAAASSVEQEAQDVDLRKWATAAYYDAACELSTAFHALCDRGASSQQAVRDILGLA